MKGDLSDPRGFLHSWKATDLGGACSGAWTGIKCVNGNVATITLPWHGLAGTLSAPWLGQLTRLRRLSLHDNAIVGAFPSSLGFLPDLHGLYLFNNRFSGTVPPEIDCCLMLQSFDASSNLLTGVLPGSIANSTKLIRLNLSCNAISGKVPAEVVGSSSLLFLDLSYKKLSGHIPDSFGGGSKAPSSSSWKEAVTGSYQLIFLSLAHNSLDGPVPESLGGLSKLQELDLAGNNLNGSIPPQLGSLHNLRTLDLSNELTGDISESLANLTTTLLSFNVSYNNLARPASLAQKFGHTSFAGNILLCGYFASSPPCPVSTSPAPASTSQGTTGCHGLRKFSSKELVLIIAGIVIGVLILLSLCCLLLCLLTRKKKSSTGTKAQSGKQLSSKDATGAGAAAAAGQGEKLGASKAESGGNVGVKLVHFNGPLVFTADDLLCTTAEIMGKSTYDTVYKATLEDGSLLAVKRLREKITKGQKEFEAEAAALGKVRHPNLLSLRAYNLGPKGEKLLVIDYIPKGSLSAFLHTRAPNTPVDWMTRMAIAKGTAHGLA
ncbi:LOW QUALITY PROTEIN: hypothetical protein CFC21_042849 [Triticum aestivum]|uniref:Protein kinase domain-containing protein n=2 Tax=Triticum aestivum TaxID=4565 RepID=A0A9R1FMN4_WHEAT|nr:LOW QUALITY PROTEIN: hypothetical protein CFC21_042849 [Triticum aestivum]